MHLLALDYGTGLGFHVEALYINAAAAAIITTVWLAIHWRKKKNITDRRPPAAPVGILECMKGMTGSNRPFFFLDMAERSGSDIYTLPIGITVVGDPTVIRKILQDKQADKPSKFYNRFGRIFGDQSIFSRSSSDAKWKAVRKGTVHAFSSTEIDRMNRICLKRVEEWIENTLEPCIENGETFDPSKEMCKLTFRVILESAFEYADITDDDFNYVTHHLELVLKEIFNKGLNTFRKFYAPLLSEYRNAVKSCKKIQLFGQKILDAYRSNTNKSANKTVIRLLVENTSFTSDKERVAEIVTFLIAGHDTTGYTLGTALTLLAKNKNVSEKLYRELTSTTEGSITKKQKSGYLKHVIDESNRLWPVAAAGTIRITGRDIFCKDDGSVIIPKGTYCVLPQILPNRNPFIFKDPNAFRPERWDTATAKDAKVMRGAISQFSLGPRNCIGQSLAVAEVYSVLPRLLADYKFDVAEEGELDYFLTLKWSGVLLRPSRVTKTLLPESVL